jgi:UDP-N-acetylmuramate dehydrogenase
MPDLLTSHTIAQLKKKFAAAAYLNINLADNSRWRVGGIAKCIIAPESEQKLIECICFCSQHNLRYVLLGATSNLLFADEGLVVLGISLARLKSIEINNLNVTAQAGLWVPQFARRLANMGLTGLEHIVGIPGSLGGLLYMNGGSQRKGIGSHVLHVKTINANGDVVTYNHEACDFSYRHSSFQHRNEIIVSVELQLAKAPVAEVRREMLNILSSRRKKFPLKQPNCGSVFVSDPAMYEEYGPPGAVIERCQLKGVQQGGAQVSPEHANFIINTGGAKARDILILIKHVQQVVYRATGYNMVSEVRYVDSAGNTCPAADVNI